MVSQINTNYVNDYNYQPQAQVAAKSGIMSDVTSSIFNPITGIMVGSEVKKTIKADNIANNIVQAPVQGGFIKRTYTGIKNSGKGFFKAVKNANYSANAPIALNTLKNPDGAQTLVNLDQAILSANGTNVDITKLKDSRNAILKGLENGDDIKDLVKSADEAIDATKASIKGAKTAANATESVSLFGKIKNGITKPFKFVGSKVASLGITKAISSKIPNCIKSAGSKLFKGTGAALNIVLEGGIELFTNVIPAFKQGGFKSGMKQIGKSSVKVGASIGGFAAGAKGGAALGGAIGSFICPGIGTAIGTAIGSFIGGMVGSSVSSKVAQKIVGKDETEKIAEANTQATEATTGEVQAQPTVQTTNPFIATDANGAFDFTVPSELYPTIAVA